MTYTLDECIINSTRLKRHQHVLKTLHDNDIYSFNDLVAKPIPTKGLWKSEVKILCDMRSKETMIKGRRMDVSKALREKIARYASPHETTRIANLLQANDICSMSMLLATRPSRLREIYGIGPKSEDILIHVIADYYASRRIPRSRGGTVVPLQIPSYY